MDKRMRRYALKNHLDDILKKKGITQKELADAIEERPNNISDFINLKRSTINIELLVKIANFLEETNIEKILSFIETFRDERYRSYEWYVVNIDKYDANVGTIWFSFFYENNREVFSTMEVTKEGLLITSEFALTGVTSEEIDSSFEVHELNNGPEDEKDRLMYKLIQICRYSPDNVDIKRYKDRGEAMEMALVIEGNSIHK